MTVNVAFNGLGRIGRLALRVAWGMPEAYNIVALNDIAAEESIAYLIKFDSIHGTWGPSVEYDAATKQVVITDGDRVAKIAITREADPSKLDYSRMDVKVVMESTGVHLTSAKLQPYFDKGVLKVVVSAPVKDGNENTINLVVGCNDDKYDAAKHSIVTAASCTTNCLGPLVKVMHEKLGIVRGMLTTIHCVTNTQTIIDAPNTKKSDLRRARSGLMNLAPTSTGSATAITIIFPELKGKLNGLAVRVPLTNSSLTDAVFEVERDTTAEEVNQLLTEAADTYLKNVLRVETQPLVSMDFVNDPHSSIVDALSTMVVDGKMVKIYAWYDNEWGYSCRMAEIGKMVIESL
eukprot:jgi/Ulvmu1/7445/UM036_0107.1